MEAADRGTAERAVTELSHLAVLHGEMLRDLRRAQAEQRWWKRAALLFALLVSVRFLTACGGAPFETSSRDGSPLAGAPSSAGAQAAGSSAALSGGAGGAAAGSPSEIPDAPGGAGGSGDVDSGGAPTIHLPCDTKAWKASAFASRPAELPELAVDGSAASRWSSGEAREPGQWFGVELGAGVVLERLEIRTLDYPGDVPSSLELELDGEPVDALATSPEAGRLVLSFVPRPASSARLVLTSSALTWWSIAEIAGVCQ